MNDNNNDTRPVASYRTMELAVAAAAFIFGAVVLADSARLGAGWSDDGPQAGYFPFYIGLIICACSASIRAMRCCSSSQAASPSATS